MKFRVSWWIHGAGGICRGYDIVEAKELDEYDVEELIEEDLSRALGESTSKYDFPSRFVPNLPKFSAKHQELTFASRHSEISNWGVLKVTCPLRDDYERVKPYASAHITKRRET